jgi:hypothetical protein
MGGTRGPIGADTRQILRRTPWPPRFSIDAFLFSAASLAKNLKLLSRNNTSLVRRNTSFPVAEPLTTRRPALPERPGRRTGRVEMARRIAKSPFHPIAILSTRLSGD